MAIKNLTKDDTERRQPHVYVGKVRPARKAYNETHQHARGEDLEETASRLAKVRQHLKT